MESLIDNSVNLGGDQVIKGTKTISNDGGSSKYQEKFICENLDFNNLPTVNAWGGIQFEDINETRICKFGPGIKPDGTVVANINCSRPVNGTITYCTLNACVGADGATWIESPASDKNKSIVTTVSKNKAQNGYVKLGNGIIIQWGHSSSFGTDTVVTLPTPFSNANYSVVPTILSSTNYGYPTYLKAHTATNFTGRRNDGNKPEMLWVAIGY